MSKLEIREVRSLLWVSATKFNMYATPLLSKSTMV